MTALLLGKLLLILVLIMLLDLAHVLVTSRRVKR